MQKQHSTVYCAQKVSKTNPTPDLVTLYWIMPFFNLRQEDIKVLLSGERYGRSPLISRAYGMQNISNEILLILSVLLDLPLFHYFQ